MAERHFEVRPQVHLAVKDERGRVRDYVFQGEPFGAALTGENALAIDSFEELRRSFVAAKLQLQMRVSELGGRKGMPLELVAILEPKAAPAAGCTHEGIGEPGCPTCDPRTKSEGGPRPDPDAQPATGGPTTTSSPPAES